MFVHYLQKTSKKKKKFSILGIGQTKDVEAIRFITKNTIEERMMELQDKKKLMIEGCIDVSIESLTQLTKEDIRFLFK